MIRKGVDRNIMLYTECMDSPGNSLFSIHLWNHFFHILYNTYNVVLFSTLCVGYIPNVAQK